MKVTTFQKDFHGRQVTREVNLTIDVESFLGTACYSALIVAANSHLSVADIEHFLDMKAREVPGVARSRNWIIRRRWWCQPPGSVNPTNRPNKDGDDARAVRLMAANPTLSLRKTALLLKEHGIVRGREWVRTHRCDGMR